MAIFDTTAFSSALKIVYGPRIVSQVNDRLDLLPLFTQSSDEWEGLRVEFPVSVGRAQSFMAHGSLGLLPTAQNETTALVQIPVKWIRGRIQFEIAVMKASMRSRGAFARANQLLIDRLVTNLADERNRMLSAGDGRGVFALVDDTGGTDADGDLGVDAPGGIASDGFGSRFIQNGMLVAFHDGTDIRSIREVDSTFTEGATLSEIRLKNSVSQGTGFFANNDYISRAANASVTNLTRDTSYNNEPMGIEGIVDDSTLVNVFHNVNRTTYPAWQSTVLSVTALSLDALQRLEDTIDMQSGESITDHLVHHSVRRQYLALVETVRSFMQTGKGPMAFDLGMEPVGMAVTYNGRPITAGKDVQLGRWIAVNRNHLTHYVLVAGEWAEETGSMFRAVAGQDALEAIYRVAENFSSDRPNAHGKLTGLSISNAIARHVD